MHQQCAILLLNLHNSVTASGINPEYLWTGGSNEIMQVLNMYILFRLTLKLSLLFLLPLTFLREEEVRVLCSYGGVNHK